MMREEMLEEARRAPGMKQRELTPCAACGRGVCHDQAITFWRVTFERFVVMFNAVRRQHGLELVVGSPAIAAALGPDEDMAKRAGDADRVVICDKCSIESCLAELIERIERRRNEAAEDSTDEAP